MVSYSTGIQRQQPQAANGTPLAILVQAFFCPRCTRASCSRRKSVSTISTSHYSQRETHRHAHTLTHRRTMSCAYTCIHRAPVERAQNRERAQKEGDRKGKTKCQDSTGQCLARGRGTNLVSGVHSLMCPISALVLCSVVAAVVRTYFPFVCPYDREVNGEKFVAIRFPTITNFTYSTTEEPVPTFASLVSTNTAFSALQTEALHANVTDTVLQTR